MAAGSFKVHCLAVMDEVQAKRETVVITKHGKPVVKLIPVEKGADDIYNFLAGNGAITGDVIAPAISGEDWGRTQLILSTRMLSSGAVDHSQLSKNARAAIDDARPKGDRLAISSVSTSASNLSCMRSRRASSSYRSAAAHACAPSDFQQLIRRIPRIAS